MTEKEMLEQLEFARKTSEEFSVKVYALSNGKQVTVIDERTYKKTREDSKKRGYWVAAIFENGHRVEA